MMFHVHHVPIHEEENASIYVVFPVGAAQDPIGKEGMAHLIEHLMFGKKNKTMMDRLNSIGIWNAYTTHDYTMYYINTTIQKFTTAIDHMLTLCSSFEVNDTSVKEELQIVMHEKGQRFIDTFMQLPTVHSQMTQNTAYSKSIIGSKRSLLSITTDDVIKFYLNYYTKGLFFFACNKTRAKEIYKFMRDHALAQNLNFPALEKKRRHSEFQKFPHVLPFQVKPFKSKVVIYSIPTHLGMTSVTMGFKVDAPNTFLNYCSLNFIAYIVRKELFKKLRLNLQIAYSPVCEVSTYDGYYIFTVQVVCTVKEIETSLKTIIQCITSAKSKETIHKTNYIRNLNMNIGRNVSWYLSLCYNDYLNGNVPPLKITATHIDINQYKNSLKLENCNLLMLGNKNVLKRLRNKLILKIKTQ